MAAPRSESQLVTKVLEYIRGLPRSHAHKIHGSRYSDAGEPDIDACIDGRSVKIELKMPGNKPTPVQMASMRRWERSGALVFWATSLDEVLTYLDFVDLPDFTNPQLCKHATRHELADGSYCCDCRTYP